MPLPEGCGHLLPCWDTLVKSSTCLQVRQTRINTGRSGNLAPNRRFSPDPLDCLLSQKRTLPITGGDEVLVASQIGQKAPLRCQRGSWCYKQMAAPSLTWKYATQVPMGVRTT
jgi:hypothetical protein